MERWEDDAVGESRAGKSGGTIPSLKVQAVFRTFPLTRIGGRTW